MYMKTIFSIRKRENDMMDTEMMFDASCSCSFSLMLKNSLLFYVENCHHFFSPLLEEHGTTSPISERL